MSIRTSFIRSLLVLSSLTLAGTAFARRPPVVEQRQATATSRADDGYRDMLARRPALARDANSAVSGGYRDMLARGRAAEFSPQRTARNAW